MACVVISVNFGSPCKEVKIHKERTQSIAYMEVGIPQYGLPISIVVFSKIAYLYKGSSLGSSGAKP